MSGNDISKNFREWEASFEVELDENAIFTRKRSFQVLENTTFCMMQFYCSVSFVGMIYHEMYDNLG